MVVACSSEEAAAPAPAPVAAAAPAAAPAAAHDHGRLLLLAGEPGRLAELPAAGRLRHLHRVRLVRELPRPVRQGADVLGNRRPRLPH